MSKKTINFNRPAVVDKPDAENWVADKKIDASKPKRFTIDISFELHRRVKMACVERGVNMTDVFRELLETEFPPQNRKSA